MTGGYLAFVLAILAATVVYSSPGDLLAAVGAPEIRFAVLLSFTTCTISALLSLLVAVPTGYLLSRRSMRGKWLLEAALDIPIFLPPMVIGLCLLIFFQTALGRWIEGGTVTFTYTVYGMVLAQWVIGAAFAIRTMRGTFQHLSARPEQVAQTLGCSEFGAFWHVALPSAGRGMVAAGTIAWARSLGEFGPILVFAGATRMKTEVLPTTVWLELSVGQSGGSGRRVGAPGRDGICRVGAGAPRRGRGGAMIELRRVSIVAGGFALSEIDFEVGRGEYAVIMGKTGSGKTTILEAICGLRQVTGGRVLLGGKDVTDQPPAARSIGFVPQDLALFPTLTVRGQLEFGPRRIGFSKARMLEKVDELSGLLGISDLLDRKVQALSGGEAQRVALGRALAAEPPVLLMDEPLSALDEWTRDEIYEVLRRVRQTLGVTTLHITHRRAEARALGTRWFVLQAGTLREVEDGGY